uniref:Uncharacterized protein n=1 Tax=Arundo donax TaxID=35708 RepID=A0A0A9E9T0_ARUDO
MLQFVFMQEKNSILWLLSIIQSNFTKIHPKL